MRSDKYKLQGKEPVVCDDLMDWAASIEDSDARRVALDEVATGITVSTVFLGLDHRFGQGPPLLFETMVFGGALDGESDRYSTWDEAEQGHNEIVRRVLEAAKSTL